MTVHSRHTDSELISLLKKGNEKAFTLLYERYWEKLFVIAAAKLQNCEDAEEIVQEIFLDLWNRRNEIDITSTVEGYLATAVKYKVINHFARRKKYREILHSVRTKTVEDTTEEWLKFQELKERLAKHLNGLPEKCKIVFKLSREEGLSQKEIAAATNTSEKTVESHISTALKTLRASLRNFFTIFF